MKQVSSLKKKKRLNNNDNKESDNNNERDENSVLISETIKEIFQNFHKIDDDDDKEDKYDDDKSRIDNLYYYIDSLPGVDSIFSLFTLRCIDLNEVSLSSVSELYIEFVKECRKYWENVYNKYIYNMKLF